MIQAYLEAVGMAAPGLPNWQAAKSVLTGNQPYSAAPLEKYKPSQLPANEARRATELVRMAFRVCEEVQASSTLRMQDCASVFASSGGDYPIIDQICRSLCEPERLVSPTQFHNSVHNSAAGYWSIATQSQQPSTALSAYDHSFCAGLTEAMMLCQSEQIPTLLAVYDIKPPYPLSEKRLITAEFGVAFLLTPTASTQTIAHLQLATASECQATTCANADLESLRLANPAARSLPLLELLARNETGQISLPAGNQSAYRLQVTTCI